MSERSSVEVLIVGGGHAGLLLGVALVGVGVGVKLVERQPLASILDARPDGRALALLGGSVAILRRLGVWEQVGPYTAAIERAEVVDVAGGVRVHYDSAEHGGQPFGAGVEQTALRRALLEAFLDRAGEAALLQGEVAALQRTGGVAAVTLADGRVLDDTDAPIPGLYGIGNCVASFSGGSYWAGGATLGPIIAFAYRSALAIAGDPTAAPVREPELAGTAG